MLLCSQHIAGAADLQIPHGYPYAGSKLREFPDGLQAFLRLLPQKLIPLIHQKCIRSPVRASHAAAQLIELGQSHPVRVVNDHGVGIRNVQPGLDDSRGYQHIDLSVYKVKHDFFQLPLLHLSMGVDHYCIFGQLLNVGRNFIDSLHSVIDIVHLAVSGQLACDRLTNHLIVVFHHIGLDGKTIHRRLLKYAHVPDPYQAHMQGPGNGRCRQSQHVNIFLELFDLFLVRHPEALLFIDNQQSQILKLYILGQYPVGSDHHIDQPLLQIRNRLFHLRRGPETGEQIHPHRKILHSLQKSIVMLLGKNGRGDQIDDLLTLLDCLKCCPQRNLCLAIAYISANQAIHDFPALHISLGRLNSLCLILGLFIRKQLLKFLLPHRIRAILISGSLLPGRIQLHEILRDLLYRALHPAAGALPLFASQLVELRRFGIRSGILLDSVQPCRRQIQIPAVRILNLQIILDYLVPLNLLNPPVNAQSVILMYHIISH